LVKVSVIVPVYNVENYLKRCFDSILNQTFKDFEIIAVNDGSSDGSQKIIDKYAKKYSNFKGYKTKNGGVSRARNFGISKASGEYYCFIDSDDYIDSTMLEKMYNEITSKNLDVVVCDYFKVYDDLSKREYLKSVPNYSNDFSKNYLISYLMVAIRMFKSEIFEDIKFKEDFIYEDLEILLRIHAKYNKVGYVEEGLYYYYQRSGSIMHQLHFNESLLDIFDALDINRSSLENDYRDEIEYLYITHLLRSTILRFIDFKVAKKYVEKILTIMKNDYPKWYRNIYFKKSNKKLQIICYLAYYRQFWLLKILKKVSGNRG